MSGFLWPLFIVTHNFSVVVTYVIVRSSRRQRFNFRTYFHCHFRLFRTHSTVAGVHFELYTVRWKTCCALVSSCRFDRVLAMRKRKCKVMDELKSIRVSEMVSTSGKPNSWYVNQELTCLWRTRAPLIFESTWNARSTRKLLEVKRVQQK
jgi:hypothetical protein